MPESGRPITRDRTRPSVGSSPPPSTRPRCLPMTAPSQATVPPSTPTPLTIVPDGPLRICRSPYVPIGPAEHKVGPPAPLTPTRIRGGSQARSRAEWQRSSGFPPHKYADPQLAATDDFGRGIT
jgi:hypothetical protein